MQPRTAWTTAAILAGLVLIGWATWPQWAPQPRGPNTALIINEHAHPDPPTLSEEATRTNAPDLAKTLDRLVESEAETRFKTSDPGTIEAYCTFLAEQPQDLDCSGAHFTYRNVTFRAAKITDT